MNVIEFGCVQSELFVVMMSHRFYRLVKLASELSIVLATTLLAAIIAGSMLLSVLYWPAASQPAAFAGVLAGASAALAEVVANTKPAIAERIRSFFIMCEISDIGKNTSDYHMLVKQYIAEHTL